MESIRFLYDAPAKWGIDDDHQPRLSGSDSPRRSLLAHSLRVTPSLFPDVSTNVEAAAANAGMADVPATFIANSAEPNAVCIPWATDEGHDFAVMLTSALVSLLSPSELQFVIGHEIGHFIYRHFNYPPVGEEASVGERLANLNLQRAAEISADRAGLLAVKSTEEACTAMIKTSCGLGPPHLRIHVPTVLEQFRELTDELGGHTGAAFDTHPMLAIRIRSMLWFSMTNAFHEFQTGRETGSWTDLRRVDEAIRRDLDKATGFSYETWEDESLAAIRLWAVLLLFVSDNCLSKEEQQILADCFGEEHARNAIAFVRSNGNRSPAAVRQRFQEACEMTSRIARQKLLELFSEMEKVASAASGDSEVILECLRIMARNLDVEREPRIVPWEPVID